MRKAIEQLVLAVVGLVMPTKNPGRISKGGSHV